VLHFGFESAPYYFHKDWKWNESKLKYKQEETAEKLAETIKAYQNLGKNVVLVYSAPLLGNPKVCAERKFRLGSEENLCQITKGGAESTNYYRPFVEGVVKASNIKVFDPYLYLCDENGCKVKDGAKVFYASQAHFSGSGGQYLARKAAPDLKKLLQF
jgi:hypothetical protein